METRRAGRRAAVLGAAAAAVGQRHAVAQPGTYQFDQRAGRLDFTAHHLGMFTSVGRFDGFQAEVLLDPNEPTRAAVDVTVDLRSVMLSWPGAVELLCSREFFDVEAFPMAHFRGEAMGAGEAEDFGVAGELTMRGITHPFAMRAKLLERVVDPTLGAEVAEFSARGPLSRSAYGMVAEQLVIADEVAIGVRVRLILGGVGRG